MAEGLLNIYIYILDCSRDLRPRIISNVCLKWDTFGRSTFGSDFDGDCDSDFDISLVLFVWLSDWLVLPFCSIGSFSIGEFAWLGHVVGSFGWHVWLVNSVDSHDYLDLDC